MEAEDKQFLEIGDWVLTYEGERGVVTELTKNESDGSFFYIATVILQDGAKIKLSPEDVTITSKYSSSPIKWYLSSSYRSWRVKALGYEKKCLEENIPLLLDKITVNWDSIDELLYYDNNQTVEGYIVAHNFDLASDLKTYTIWVESPRLDSDDSLNLVSVTTFSKLERFPQIDEFLVHESSLLRELAYEIHNGETPRAPLTGWST